MRQILRVVAVSSLATIVSCTPASDESVPLTLGDYSTGARLTQATCQGEYDQGSDIVFIEVSRLPTRLTRKIRIAAVTALSAVPNGLKDLLFKGLGGRFVVAQEDKVRASCGGESFCVAKKHASTVFYSIPDETNLVRNITRVFGYLVSYLGHELAKEKSPELQTFALFAGGLQHKLLRAYIADANTSKHPGVRALGKKVAKLKADNMRLRHYQVMTEVFDMLMCSTETRAKLTEWPRTAATLSELLENDVKMQRRDKKGDAQFFSWPRFSRDTRALGAPATKAKLPNPFPFAFNRVPFTIESSPHDPEALGAPSIAELMTALKKNKGKFKLYEDTLAKGLFPDFTKPDKNAASKVDASKAEAEVEETIPESPFR